MTLAVYPAIPKPSYSYSMDHQLKTDVVDYEGGYEQRNRRWRFPRRTFILIYKLKSFTATQRDAISDFYYQRHGSYELFWFFDWQERKWIDQYVGQGDGATQTFDLPGTSTGTTGTVSGILTEGGDRLITEDNKVIIEDTYVSTIPIVYVNGVSTPDFSLSLGTGQGERIKSYMVYTLLRLEI